MLTQVLVSQSYEKHSEALAIFRMYGNVARRFPGITSPAQAVFESETEILDSLALRWAKTWWFSSFICLDYRRGRTMFEVAVSYVAPVIPELPFSLTLHNADVQDAMVRRAMAVPDIFNELAAILKLASMHEGLITCEPHR